MTINPAAPAPADDPVQLSNEELDEMGPKHTAQWWIQNANTGEECDSCYEADDLCPAHHGAAEATSWIGAKLVALGHDTEQFENIVDTSSPRDD